MTGSELRDALRFLGLTQRGFALWIGYTEGSVSRWVRGQLPIPLVVDRLVWTLVVNKIVLELHRGAGRG